jgi:hypothetical protein
VGTSTRRPGSVLGTSILNGGPEDIGEDDPVQSLYELRRTEAAALFRNLVREREMQDPLPFTTSLNEYLRTELGPSRLAQSLLPSGLKQLLGGPLYSEPADWARFVGTAREVGGRFNPGEEGRP